MGTQKIIVRDDEKIRCMRRWRWYDVGMDTTNETTNRPAQAFALGDTVAMANEPKRTGMVMGHRWNEQLDEWTVTVAWDGYRLPRGPEWDADLAMAVRWHWVTRDGRPAVSVHCEASLTPIA